MDKFDFLLPDQLKQSLEKAGYLKPTPIQAKAIPIVLEGKDLVGLAQTGTGKTGVFLIPLIAKMIENPRYSVLILTPTRELGQQIFNLAKTLSPQSCQIQTALLIGGQKFFFQKRDLEKGARLIIGTPGRVIDHLQQKTLNLSRVNTVVLDETDRLLDTGFEDQLKELLSYVPEARQTLLFSATLPKAIRHLVSKYLKDPEEVSIGEPNRVADRVSQSVSVTQEKDKELLEALSTREGSILVFVNSQRGVEKVASNIKDNHHRVDALHGGMRQSRRDRVLKGFRNKRFRILVATDVAARGLDIPHIAHVINYELPFSAEDYVHRIGRTARAEATGESLSLVSPYEKRKWDNIERFLQGKEEKSAPRGRFPNKRRSSFRSGSNSYESQGGHGGHGGGGHGGFRSNSSRQGQKGPRSYKPRQSFSSY
jgi:superfamily II DNA/RNA helicase